MSLVIMNNEDSKLEQQITGMVVKPIQEVTNDFEEQGLERVANEPTLRYTE